MKKEPIRHHYIPQFILRNFSCDDDRNLVYFYDKESSSISKCAIRELFMEKNLYRDEINNADAPVQIEHDLAAYESEIAKLIKSKFLSGRKIELTKDEDAMLKLFCAIMSFRNINAKEKFSQTLSKESKDFYKYYQKNENFEDFWKRNLGYLVKCRSMIDVVNHPNIDYPIKLFMKRDTNSLVGKYIIVVEPKEGDRFILGDCYPLVLIGDFRRLPLYDVLPISPNRAIILASVGVTGAPQNVLTLRKGVFDTPEINENGNCVIITKRLHLNEVQFINREIERHSHKGFIFSKSNIDKIENG